ncbi:phage major capsid E family protein [Burkholderia sp. MSHR3999]|uniref:major capsid protein n=1 Tax=Burkholderia sp. MSHR3999 TaxID=1542965 RepID=UPI0005AC6846|nr:major capsid protein [Burkholderia sp. MSHR3999]KIP14270.1 phage major capsid E family protein [Burkholderia sp. MSHR3999]
MSAYSIFDTAELVQLIQTVFEPENFLLNSFFPSVMEFETKEILFERFTENESIAPFVSPNVAGRPMRREGRVVQSFAPAYLKPLHAVQPEEAFRRSAGEAIGAGTLSPQERFLLATQRALQKQLRAIERRMEWMAAQALVNGSVVVVGDDYPSVTVDFARDPGNTIALAGAALWSQPTATPLDDLETWSMIILELTGAAGSDVIMTPDVWNAIKNNPAFLDLFKRYQNLGGPLPNVLPAAQKRNLYKGQLGNFNLWVYQDWYRDEQGNKISYLPPGTVVMVASGDNGIAGVQAYGAIQDLASLVAQRFFAKMWEQPNPSAAMLMTQSAPLVVPSRPNATVSAKVL